MRRKTRSGARKTPVSTVRWTATNRSVYAVGPSNVDPRTGES